MLAKIDPIGKIQQLYMEGRPVPYLAFMYVFNGLLADPTRGTPAAPDVGLAENFRAACMAANVGVIDTEGRGEERLQEFRDKVYPLWKSKLTPDQFARFERIYEGKMRETGQEEQAGGERIALKTTAKSSALLKRLGLIESQDGEQVTITGRPRAVGGNGAVGPEAFDTVDDLCAAIQEGRLRVEFMPLTVKTEPATYRLDDVLVGVRWGWGKQKDSKNHLLLTARIGYGDIPGTEKRLDRIASEMGFVKQAKHAYMRWDDDFGYTLKVGPKMTNVAVASPNAGALENTPLRIQRGHRDLGEFIERLRG